MILTGVISETTRFTGIYVSRRDACKDVLGNPSKMNEAIGESEGEAGPESESEDLGDIQSFACSSDKISCRIILSGTRDPDFMCDSASRPG